MIDRRFRTSTAASPSRIWTHARADSLRATSRRCGASSHNPAGRAPSPALRGPRDGIRPTSPRSSVAALWAARRRALSRICSMRPPLMLRRPFGRLFRGRSGHHSQAGRASAPGSWAMFTLAGGRRFCRRRSQSGLCVGRGRNRPRALFQSESAKDQLHRVDRGWPVADAAVLGSASSSAATLPSSSSMTRISTLPSMARSAMRPDLRVRQRLYCPPLPGWEQELLEIVRCGQTEDDHRATRRILPGSRKGLKHFAVHLPRNKCR